MLRRAPFFMVLLALGCSPGVFGDLEEGASTRVYRRARGFGEGTFGTQLATYQGQVGSGMVPVSRIVTAGGRGEPYAVYSLWQSDQPVFELRTSSCDDEGECERSTGAAVAGIPEWAGQGACAIITAPDEAATAVVCEGQSRTNLLDTERAGEELGASVAGIPVAGNPVGVAILGAPAADGGRGRLYRLEDGATRHTPLDTELDLLPGARLGEVLALGVLPPGVSALSDAVLLAATASGTHRVHLFAVGTSTGAGVTTDLLGCVDGPEGFGASLAIGDLTGEGDPELVVGQSLNANPRSDAVWVYQLADFRDGAGCELDDASDDPPAEEVACPSDLGIECEGSGFGASLAIGDVNADLLGDLLVGAPLATVRGKNRAGAAFLFSGNMGRQGDESVDTLDTDVLVDSHPDEDGRLGSAVAMVRSHLGISAPERDEPVVSAPGAEAIFVFLCTALEDVAALADRRCLEL